MTDVAGAMFYVASSSGSDTYTATLNPAPAALTTGMEVRVQIASANTTTTPTLNLNSLGAKTIVRQDGTAVVAGDLNGNHVFVYDGTNMRVQNPIIATTISLGSLATKSTPTVADSSVILDAAASNAVKSSTLAQVFAILQPYMIGFTGWALSNDGSTPNSVLDYAAGFGISDDKTTLMSLAAYKKTLSAWTVGSGNGGLDTATVSPVSCWLHQYAINRTDTAVTDLLMSLAPPVHVNNPLSGVTITIASPAVVTWADHGLQIGSPVVFTTTGALPTGLTAGTVYFVITAGFAVGSFRVSATQGGSVINTTGSQSGVHTGTSTPTLPANYTKKRYLQTWPVNSGGNLVTATQNGDDMILSAPLLDINDNALATTANLYQVSVPRGIKVTVFIRTTFENNLAGTVGLMSSPDEASIAGGSLVSNVTWIVPGTAGTATAVLRVSVNTSAQVRAVSGTGSGNSTLTGEVYGWTHNRLKS